MAHETYIKDVSDADSVVLFIHGFLGSPEHFERFISLIPENISIYNILLKGHGGSVADFGNASMKEWKKQISDIIDELNKKYQRIFIVAHSMGTFFAMESALKYPDTIKSIFLLQMPLKIGVKPKAAVNTFKSFFNTFSDDEISRAYKNSHSVKLNFRIWEYIGWIPRYLELFKESHAARGTILKIETPCMIFQSAKDELVSRKSVKYIPGKENIMLSILDKSAHFIYNKEEIAYLEKKFCEMIGCNAF